MAEGNNLLKEKAKLLADIKRIQTEQGIEAAKLDGAYQKAIDRLKEIVKIIKASEVAQQKTADSVQSLRDGAESLGSVYQRISTEQLKQADIQTDIANSISTTLQRKKNTQKQNNTAYIQANSILQAYEEQASIARELSQLTSKDTEKKAQLNSEFDLLNQMIEEELGSMDKRLAVTKDFMAQQSAIAESVRVQKKDADELSSLTVEQKGILEQQAAVFDSMKKKVDALGSTLTTFLRRPQAIIGGLFIGAGALVDKFADVNRQLGNGFDILNSTTASAGVLGFVFEDTAGTVKALASEFGGTEAATFQTQANIGLMATNMGISNTEAVSLSGSFARLNGNSTDIAADMVKTTQEFAKQNGVVPSALMADLAASTEEFALFGRDGGENILRAAGFASKLGTNMKTLSGIAEGLLDFESSITKELELGAMLGKNINLDRARQLALEGDIEGATNATLDALGGIEAFNEMDYFQKKATADLLGVSVGELQKMAQNQQNANSLGAVMNERFSAVGETLNAGLNKYLGTGLKGLGGMITMTGQLGTGFKALGVDMGDIVKKSAAFVKNMVKAGAQKVGKLMGIGGKATQSIGSKATSNLGGAAKGAGGGMKSMGKGMGAGLKGLAKGIGAFANPATLLGLAAVTAAIIGIGFALKIAAPGIKAFGEAIGNIVKSVGTAVATIFGGLGDFFGKIAAVATPELALSIIGIAGGFGALTASLAAFSVVGLAAVPAMAAISAFGAVSGLLGMGEEGVGGKEKSPEWAINLEKAIRETKDVYMDAVKVTGVVIDTANKIGSNSYAIK